MSLQEVASRSGVSYQTVRAIEMGSLGTAIGNYLQVLWTLGLLQTVSSVADPMQDATGIILESATRRENAGRRNHFISNDF